MIFSAIIPCSQKDLKSQKLQDLIESIKTQDFPQDQIEILIETEGDSEQAKANGIRKAKGEICAMFCADNYIVDERTFRWVWTALSGNPGASGCYTKYYAAFKNDNSLNRYFSFIGNNDPIAFYLGKNDRFPHDFDGVSDPHIEFDYIVFRNKVPSLGDNGFFYRREHIIKADIDHYYPMDCAEDLRRLGHNCYIRFHSAVIWHRTSDNLISFLIKRYKYARDLYCDREDRRWKMVDTKEDKWRLFGFVIATIATIPCLIISIRGFFKIKDWAWFYHPLVCWGFLITYSLLAFRNLFKHGNFFQVRCHTAA